MRYIPAEHRRLSLPIASPTQANLNIKKETDGGRKAVATAALTIPPNFHQNPDVNLETKAPLPMRSWKTSHLSKIRRATST